MSAGLARGALGTLLAGPAAKFILVGLANNAVGYGIFILLSLLGAGALPAMTVSYVVGMGISFFGNRQWTFAHKGSIGPAVVRFLGVNVVGYSLNYFLLWFLVDVNGLPQIPVQFGAIAAVAVCTFFLMRVWVFSGKKAARVG
ncbi:GtrA family protein [Arthrobacter sp. 35W]|uniref:GtrA family protein n=1 Tax=Arthrobacter sp. 35W TaxID=1132441 RepID=UPI00040C3515|nr:GtrA family protein [Arthrobacter sp. 35W]